jgi:hypothetical protein
MRPNDLGPFWMPFTPNRSFKAAPRMLVRIITIRRGARCSMPARDCGA